MMSGCPTTEEIDSACLSVVPKHGCGGQARSMVPMRSVALDGIGIVSRLMESLEHVTKKDATGPVLEYSEDVQSRKPPVDGVLPIPISGRHCGRDVTVLARGCVYRDEQAVGGA